MNTRDMVRKARRCSSYHELIEMAKKSNIDLTKEEAVYFLVKANSKILCDDELENIVAGLILFNEESFRNDFLFKEGDIVRYESIDNMNNLLIKEGVISLKFIKNNKNYYKVNNEDILEDRIIK